MNRKGELDPLQSEKGETFQRLLCSARDVFFSQGFNAASVSNICQHAKISRGTFYLYFSSKEDVYLRLLEEFKRELLSRLQSMQRSINDPHEKLVQFYIKILESLAENKELLFLFREAEFMYPETIKELYNAICGCILSIIHKGIELSLFRTFNAEVVAYAVLGAVLFQVVYYVLWSRQAIPTQAYETALQLILRGLDARVVEWTEKEPVGSSLGISCEEQHIVPSEGGEATRQTILTAAEKAFGKTGFHNTSVFAIASLAGVGLGTLYHYFPSKRALFQELVQNISRGLRYELAAATRGCRDRRTAEVAGLKAFFHWVERHPSAYRILREAEFVDPRLGRSHYVKLISRYAYGLRIAMAKNEIRHADPEALACALVGIAHLSGQRWVLWEQDMAKRETAVSELGRLLVHGLAIE